MHLSCMHQWRQRTIFIAPGCTTLQWEFLSVSAGTPFKLYEMSHNRSLPIYLIVKKKKSYILSYHFLPIGNHSALTSGGWLSNRGPQSWSIAWICCISQRQLVNGIGIGKTDRRRHPVHWRIVTRRVYAQWQGHRRSIFRYGRNHAGQGHWRSVTCTCSSLRLSPGRIQQQKIIFECCLWRWRDLINLNLKGFTKRNNSRNCTHGYLLTAAVRSFTYTNSDDRVGSEYAGGGVPIAALSCSIEYKCARPGGRGLPCWSGILRRRVDAS